MKTLDQIRPGKLIAQTSLPFSIMTPGNYYVAENLSVSNGDAIIIQASGVTLDLNGFTISSNANPAAGYGVRIGNSLHDITVRNGHIVGGVTLSGTTASGPGFASGLQSDAPEPRNVLIEQLTVSGCKSVGVYLGTNDESDVVNQCVVFNIGGSGIAARRVTNSTAQFCGNYGIIAVQAENCYGVANGSSPGIEASRSAINCYGESNSGVGLNALINATDCYGTSSSGLGLFAENATNCHGFSSSGAGMSCKNAFNCYGQSNTSTGLFATNAMNCFGYAGVGGANTFGISVSGTASYSRGENAGSGTGLKAQIAIGCTGSSGSGTAIVATNPYLMP